MTPINTNTLSLTNNKSEVQHNILEKFLHSFYDEYWVLEMYAFMTEYIELITDKPTYLLPYVWNDTILKKYLMNHHDKSLKN